MAPFSLADLGLSDDEIASLDSLGDEAPAQQKPAQQTQPAKDEEPAMAPFSLADLGLSDDEIASLDSLSDTPPAPPAPAYQPPPAQDDDLPMAPFSLADLGLSDDDLTNFDTAGAATEPASQRPSAGARGQGPQSPSELPIDLRPFSLDELDLSADESSGQSGLPPSLQAFTLDEPTDRPASAPRDPLRIPTPPQASGLPRENLPDIEDDPTLHTGGYSWQQPAQRTQTGFSTPRREETPTGDSIFSKLKQRRQEIPPTEEPPLTNEIDDDPRLFSIDDVSLRDDEHATTIPAVPSQNLPNLLNKQAQQSPPAQPAQPTQAAPPAQPAAEPAEAHHTHAATRDIEANSIEEALAAGEVQPFSFADLGLSEEELAALGLGPSAAAPSAPAFEPEPEPVQARQPEPEPAPARQPEPVQARQPEPEPAPARQPEPAQTQPPHEIEDLSQALASGDVQPFSFADLGLSEEELAALGLGGETGAAPSQPSALSQQSGPAEEVEPFSFNLDELTSELDSLPAPSQQAAPSAPAQEPEEVEPFSFNLDELTSELDSLPAPSQQAAPSAPAQEPEEPTQQEIEPFTLNLDELLSDSDLPTPQVPTPSASAPPPASAGSDEEMLLTTDLKPFSLSDLGLSDEEVAALGLGGPAEIDEPRRTGLGITEEELRSLDLNDMGWSADEETPEPAAPAAPAAQAAPVEPPPAPAPTFSAPAEPDIEPVIGDPVVDRLIALGRRQGFVDISDIIAAVENPEEEEDRIEEIGRLLHEAQVEIRDGDEVIDMDADYEEEEYPVDFEESAPTPARAPEPVAPAPPSAEEDLTPFSLSELGLSDEEIAALGFDTSTPAAPAPAPSSAEEDDLTPFSLSELGLSDDEINALGLDDQPQAPPEPPRPAKPQTAPFSLDDLTLPDEPLPTPAASAPRPPAQEEPHLQPFSLSELGLTEEEIAALNPEDMPQRPAAPQPEAFSLEDDEPEGIGLDLEPPTPPTRSAPARPEPELEPFSLDNLDLLDAAPEPQRPAPPAPAARTPEPQRAEPPTPAARAPEPQRPAPSAPPEPAHSATPAPRAAPRQPAASAANLPPNIQAYLQRIDADPQNFTLRLAVARAIAQAGLTDVAAQQYRLLIRQNVMLDQVVDDLQDLIDYTDDPRALQRLYRTLGDAYSKQGLIDEAITAYNWSQSGL
jgi:hypothetical protein